MTVIRSAVAITLFVFSTAALNAQTNAKTLDGRDWKSFSEVAKVAYAAGFIEGSMTFNSDQSPASAQAKGCTGDRKGNFDHIAIGQMTDGMDEFYKDYRNQNIHLGLAMLYVRDTITGCSAEMLRKELDILRSDAVSTT